MDRASETQRAANQLTNMLRDGEAHPVGKKLPSFADLADALDLRSTAHVREVLGHLERQGLVEVIPQSGSYVRKTPAPLPNRQDPTAVAVRHIVSVQSILDELPSTPVGQLPGIVALLQEAVALARSAAVAADEAWLKAARERELDHALDLSKIEPFELS